VNIEGDEAGSEMPDEPGVPAAARFAAEGDVAGFNPGTSTGGDFCADGSCGSADRATAEESGAASLGFHQAHCGPDWHPTIAVRRVATVNTWAVVVFMSRVAGDRSAGMFLWSRVCWCGPARR
jgi:hypothetical protein